MAADGELDPSPRSTRSIRRLSLQRVPRLLIFFRLCRDKSTRSLPPCKSCPGSPPPRSQCPPSPGNWGSRRCGPVLREGTPLVRPPARDQRMSRASQQVRPAAPAQHVRSDTGLRPAATTPPGSHRRAAAGAGRGARAVPNLRNTHVLTAMFVPVHLRAEAPLHFSRRHRRRALGLAGHRHSSSDTRST